MSKCKGCGRHGMFLKLDFNGLCEACGQIQQRKDMLEREWEVLKAREKQLERLEAKFVQSIAELPRKETEPCASLIEDRDPRLPEAIEIILDAGAASTALIQRRMRIGYARAGRMIDTLEKMGIISEANGSMPRKLLVSRDRVQEILSRTD